MSKLKVMLLPRSSKCVRNEWGLHTHKIQKKLRVFPSHSEHSHCIILQTNIYILIMPGSSVGIATDYGLDGPGSNPSGDEIFRPSRLALGPTQPPVTEVPGLSRG